MTFTRPHTRPNLIDRILCRLGTGRRRIVAVFHRAGTDYYVSVFTYHYPTTCRHGRTEFGIDIWKLAQATVGLDQTIPTMRRS